MSSPRPRRPPLRHADTRYTNMLLALDHIPGLHNLLAGFFTWILLAGFVLFPGTFASLGSVQQTTLGVAEAQVIHTVQHVPLFVIAFICCGIGAIGMCWLWWRWMNNYIWIVNKIFLPGFLNALAGVISTLTSVFGSQRGVLTASSKTTIITTSVTAGICGLLTGGYTIFGINRLRKLHEREVGKLRSGRRGEGEWVEAGRVSGGEGRTEMVFGPGKHGEGGEVEVERGGGQGEGKNDSAHVREKEIERVAQGTGERPTSNASNGESVRGGSQAQDRTQSRGESTREERSRRSSGATQPRPGKSNRLGALAENEDDQTGRTEAGSIQTISNDSQAPEAPPKTRMVSQRRQPIQDRAGERRRESAETRSSTTGDIEAGAGRRSSVRTQESEQQKRTQQSGESLSTRTGRQRQSTGRSFASNVDSMASNGDAKAREREARREDMSQRKRHDTIRASARGKEVPRRNYLGRENGSSTTGSIPQSGRNNTTTTRDTDSNINDATTNDSMLETRSGGETIGDIPDESNRPNNKPSRYSQVSYGGSNQTESGDGDEAFETGVSEFGTGNDEESGTEKEDTWTAEVGTCDIPREDKDVQTDEYGKRWNLRRVKSMNVLFGRSISYWAF